MREKIDIAKLIQALESAPKTTITCINMTTGKTDVKDYPYSVKDYIKIHFTPWAGLLYHIQKSGKTYNITSARTGELLYIIK